MGAEADAPLQIGEADSEHRELFAGSLHGSRLFYGWIFAISTAFLALRAGKL